MCRYQTQSFLGPRRLLLPSSVRVGEYEGKRAHPMATTIALVFEFDAEVGNGDVAVNDFQPYLAATIRCLCRVSR